MDILKYLRIIIEGWWIIVATFLISVGGGIAYSYSQTPVYEATATFVVNPSVNIAETFDLLYSINTLAGRSSLVTTYANVMESRAIVDTALESLALPAEMARGYDISAVVLPDSNIVLLQIHGPSPHLAADLANAIGAAGLEYVSDLQEVYELHRLDAAVVQPTPISPSHPTDIALSAMIGLAGGVGFIILRQLLLQFFGEQPASISQPAPAFAERDGGPATDDRNVTDKTSLSTNLSPSQLD